MEGDDIENSNTTALAATETEPPYALMMLDSGVYTNQIIVTKTVSMLSAIGSAYIFFSIEMSDLLTKFIKVYIHTFMNIK